MIALASSIASIFSLTMSNISSRVLLPRGNHLKTHSHAASTKSVITGNHKSIASNLTADTQRLTVLVSPAHYLADAASAVRAIRG